MHAGRRVWQTLMPLACAQETQTPMSLESQLQSHLNRSRSTDLVEGAKAPASEASTRQTLRQCLRCQPESACSKLVTGRTEIRMVEYVEQLRPKLHFHGLANW